MSRRRTRATPTATRALRWLGYLTLIAVVVSGTILPAVSYHHSEVPRQTAFQTTSDTDAMLWMNTNDTVAHNATSDLIKIENTLGMGTVKVTVTLEDASTNTTLIANTKEDAESISVELDENQSVVYELDVSDDDSYLGKTLSYDVTADPVGNDNFSMTSTRTTIVEDT